MKPLKTCLKSLHNPVHIHMRPALPRSSVDNPHVVNTIIHTFFHTFPLLINGVSKRCLTPRGTPPSVSLKVAVYI